MQLYETESDILRTMAWRDFVYIPLNFKDFVNNPINQE